MQWQLVSVRRPIEGSTVQATYLYPPSQPELIAFSQRETWRYQQIVVPFTETVITGGHTGVITNGVDWAQSTVDVLWT